MDKNSGTIRITAPSVAQEGERIGRYRVLHEIGEGGCGVVYMAEQEEPVRRRVALKIIKLGMDTEQVIARFEAERQALALMDHPNIAKVLDGGATDAGRPFFVMELVRGIKITDYCDKNKLTLTERLELFVQICNAIQHAHQKGIIHRDIKPSNILVTLHDGIPVPKVIDFGIAKATTDVQLTNKTLYTRFDQFIGTPAYMSPEQAEMNALDVDTRTDIYSLGVLAYELLTGQTPFIFSAERLPEMLRSIREEEPMRPSTRAGKLEGNALTTTAQRRGLEPPKLINLLKGDLDWIAMKALEKDRTRRYQTANGFAMDVQRYLRHEPVVARPPSRLYRLRKSVQRNKLAYAAAVSIALALAVGFLGMTWLFLKEKETRQRAVTAEQRAGESLKTEEGLRREADAQAQRARESDARSKEVTRLLKGLLGSVDPAVAQGQDTRLLRSFLDTNAARLSVELKNQPLVEAELRETLGGVYLSFGAYSNSEAMFKRARILYETAGAGEHSDKIASVLNELGHTVQLEEGRERDAVRILEDALKRNKILYGPVHTNVARSLHGLGMAELTCGNLVRANKLLREELHLLAQLGDEGSPKLMEALNDLGLVLEDMGNMQEAEHLFRQALSLGEQFYGQNHPEVCLFRGNLALTLWYEGQLQQAEQLYQQNLSIEPNVMGSEHPLLVHLYNNLALVLRDLGRLEEAEKRQRQSLSLAERADPLHAGGARKNLAKVLRRRGGIIEDSELLKTALQLDPADQMSADALAKVAAARQVTALASMHGGDSLWYFTIARPATNWAMADFAASGWSTNPVVHGIGECFPRTPKTPITVHANLWLRREFELPAVPATKVLIKVGRNHDAEVFINGIRACPVVDWSDTEVLVSCLPSAQAALKRGRNVLAVHCEDVDCSAPIEVSLYCGPDSQPGRADVLAELSRLANQEPKRPDALAGRASSLARLGRWREAADVLSAAVEQTQDQPPVPDPGYCYQLGLLLIEKGDLHAYRRHRQSVLEWFSEPATAVAAQQIALLSLLKQSEGPEMTTAMRLATNAGAADYPDWNLPARQFTMGLAYYRAAQFDAAVEWLNQALVTGSKQSIPAWNHERERNRAAAAWLVLAMAHQKAGRLQKAQIASSNATEIFHALLPTPDGPDQGREWPELLIARVLKQEANSVMQEVPAGKSARAGL